MSVSYKESNTSLDMLLTYTSDVSDEESESRTSVKRKSSDDDSCIRKRLQTNRERLPLPDIAIQNEVPGEHHIDDPLQHDGRTRSFPHERGNWASFVYIPCELNLPPEFLDIVNKLSPSYGIDSQFYPCDPHVSLTRTFVLRHHWIDPFVEAIKQNMKEFSSFVIMFGGLKAYSNEEKTRTFLALEIRTGYDTLLHMVQVIDKCLEEFKLPPFYENPSFHVSIAWCNGNHEQNLMRMLPEIERYLHQHLESSGITQWMNFVQHVESSIGNKICRYYLRSHDSHYMIS